MCLICSFFRYFNVSDIIGLRQIRDVLETIGKWELYYCWLVKYMFACIVISFLSHEIEGNFCLKKKKNQF